MQVWASTWAFWLLLPIVGLVVWGWLRPRGQTRPTLRFSNVQAIAKSGRSLRSQLLWLPTFVLSIGLVLVVIAFARPQQADTKIKKNVEGIDIILVLDVSDSMLIEDMKPNRLEGSKKNFAEFVRGRTSDRIGFIIFSGESYTRVPLTLDYKLLLNSIEKTEISRNIKMGTAIGVGLANAVARLKDSTAKSRVIIFQTDGENNTGTIDPETALSIAKGYGIKIYAIGAGQDGDSLLPQEVVDAFGRKVKRYVPIHSTVNDKLLQSFADETGGKYYRASTTEALKKVFTDIDRLEKTKVDTTQFTKYAELFQRYLYWGILAIGLSAILSLTVLRRGP